MFILFPFNSTFFSQGLHSYAIQKVGKTAQKKTDCKYSHRQKGKKDGVEEKKRIREINTSAGEGRFPLGLVTMLFLVLFVWGCAGKHNIHSVKKGSS